MMNDPHVTVIRPAAFVCIALLIAGCSKSSVDAPQSNGASAPAATVTATQDPQAVATETVEPQAAAPNVKTSEPDAVSRTSPSEWAELLGGNELKHWRFAPSGSTDDDWTLRDGMLKCETGKHCWLVSHEQYADFELHFNFRLVECGNSGLYFHYSGQGKPSDSSFAIQLIEDSTYPTELQPTQRAGAVWGRVPPSKSALKPAGEWNHMLIHVEDNLIQVTLNDEMVVDVRLSELRDRPNGYLVIGNWRGEAKGCEFREMRIRRLETLAADAESDGDR